MAKKILDSCSPIKEIAAYSAVQGSHENIIEGIFKSFISKMWVSREELLEKDDATTGYEPDSNTRKIMIMSVPNVAWHGLYQFKSVYGAPRKRETETSNLYN